MCEPLPWAGKCNCLIGLHCLTGCDAVSSFRGQGKVKPAKLLFKDVAEFPVFSSLGDSFEIDEDQATQVEKFVCRLYGQHDCDDVNTVRYTKFKMGKHREEAMPPNQDSLKQHIMRANYQAAVYKSALDQFPDIPSPHGRGWIVDGESIAIHWTDLAPAPDSILEFVHCDCKKTKCIQGGCSCLEKGLPCTDLCKCVSCENTPQECLTNDGDDNDEDDDSDSESED
ncbi:uncharacterized protein [Amphiura filiformis]|uniref:uncharacterized protein n=1 Tax=Amphiura filiformis TaxID=82378 RepID=UPI003B215159